MAGPLLFVVLMCSFSFMKAQALLPPKLTVSPAVITDTDSVTLNCQTPASLSQCYFRFERGGTGKVFSCQQTLTGTELLRISHQSSPAEVKVTCFYLHGSPSPDSDASSIIIRTSLAPKLTVSPAVIKDTDSVTLNCQTPASVSVSQCFFYTVTGGTVEDVSCQQTLTATELLTMSRQRSPAEVQVTCFYNVKVGELHHPSPHSITASISIQSNKPQMSLQHFLGDHVLFVCSLPRSADGETRCNLYFGDKVHPDLTREIERKTTQKKQSFCLFTVTIKDLMQYLRLGLPKSISCDYSLGSEANSLSPRSDLYNLTDIVEKETPTFPVTTGWTVSRIHTSTQATSVTTVPTVGAPSSPVSFITTIQTSVKPASDTETSTTPTTPDSGDKMTDSSVHTPVTVDSSNPEQKTASAEKWIWKVVAVVAGCGATVGVILLVSATLWNKRKTGSEEGKMWQPKDENYDAYHLYATIAEEPAASASKSLVYSTVQRH